MVVSGIAACEQCYCVLVAACRRVIHSMKMFLKVIVGVCFIIFMYMCIYLYMRQVSTAVDDARITRVLNCGQLAVGSNVM